MLSAIVRNSITCVLFSWCFLQCRNFIDKSTYLFSLSKEDNINIFMSDYVGAIIILFSTLYIMKIEVVCDSYSKQICQQNFSC
jgi:hypothetical protein